MLVVVDDGEVVGGGVVEAVVAAVVSVVVVVASEPSSPPHAVATSTTIVASKMVRRPFIRTSIIKMAHGGAVGKSGSRWPGSYALGVSRSATGSKVASDPSKLEDDAGRRTAGSMPTLSHRWRSNCEETDSRGRSCRVSPRNR